ncbi:MAG: hypothetical protein FJ222_06235 [Lentisphaerae bacterium]|nr:hypothetical protein [Lentisphaerota bacterium]
MKRLPEILAPAGDMTCLQTALDAGADAVYLGLDTLNMRRLATRNFTRATLPEASQRCRARGVRLYLTLNTIVYEPELPELEATLREAAPFIDAAIVSDWAAVGACKRHGIPFHISTQKSPHGPDPDPRPAHRHRRRARNPRPDHRRYRTDRDRDAP